MLGSSYGAELKTGRLINNMKLLLPIILVFVYQNHVASCFEVFDYVTVKMREFKNSISSAFNTIIDKFISKKPKSEPLIQNELKSGYIGNTSTTKKTFSDFVAEEAAKSEKESPECFHLRSEPTALMSTTQLAVLHGKRIESHTVVTDDGYLLTVHRLRSPLSIKEVTESRNFTILMHHGLLGSSADWILLGPEKSLPYILSNAGCDVWLTNARGNYYSREHTSLNVDSLEFWKFSFQQMGTFDLPAVVKYIMKIKNSNEKLNFIGHSMGATAFLVMLSVYPQYNKYFRMGILLAPLVFMSNVAGPLSVLKSVTKQHQSDLMKLLGEGEFIPSRKIPLWIANKYCKGPDLYCLNPLLFLSGSLPEENSWDISLTARVLYHVPAGGSTDTILHFAQMVKYGKFHKFNDEMEEFPLKRVTVPIVLFSSSDDWLATKVDVLKLYYSIANPIDHYVLHGEKLTHTDFVWHPEADSFVFSKVVESLVNDFNSNFTRSNEINVE